MSNVLKRMVSAFVVCSFLALTLRPLPPHPAGTARAQEPDQVSYYSFEETLPEKPMLVLYSGGTSSIERLGSETALVSIWLGEGLKDSFIPPYRNAIEMLSEFDEIPQPVTELGIPLFEGLVQSPWCFVLESLEIDPEKLPDGSGPQNDMDFITELRAALMVHTPPDSPAREAADTLESLVADTLPPELLEKDGHLTRATELPVPLAWGRKGDVFVFAAGEGVAEGIFSDEPQGPGEEFIAARREIAGENEPVELIQGNFEGLLDTVKKIAEKEGNADSIDALKKFIPRSVASTSYVEGKGFREFSAVTMFDPALVRHDHTMTLEDLRTAPEDVRFLYASVLDLPEFYDRITGQIGDAFPGGRNERDAVTEALAPIEAELGFSIRDDMLEAMGTRALLYVPERSNLLMFPDPVLAIAFSDAGTFRLRLDKITDMIGQIAGENEAFSISAGTYEDTAFRFVRFKDAPLPLSPAWAVTDSHLVMAGAVPTLKTAIDRIVSDNDDSVLDSEAFSHTFDVVGREFFTSLSYIDPGGKKYLIDTLYSLLPLYNVLDHPVIEQIGFDPATLPPPERLTRHLFGSVHLTYHENDRIISEGYGPLGGGNTYIAGAAGLTGVGAAMLMPALTRAREQARKASCSSNLRQLGLTLTMYDHDNDGRMPTGATSGEVFRLLVEGNYLQNTLLLSCPSNPIDEVDFDDPDGVGYYIDPDMPERRHPLRAIAADRPPRDLNHGDGVNVLFEDKHVMFIRPEDSGPPDKISNPYIEEDTDIYADTGDTHTNAWIRWEK